MNVQPATEPKTLCAQCRAAANDEWRVRGALLQRELRRHDLTFRENQIALLILEKTYGWQRDEVIFPQLRFFTDLTGITEPEVVKVLKRLHGRRVVRIRTVKGQHVYAINPDTEAWKAMPRVSKSTLQATSNLLREHNGMEPENIEAEIPLNFKDGPTAEKTSAEIDFFNMCKPASQFTDDFPNLL